MNDSYISAGALERGRELLVKKAWTAAFAELSIADSETPLGAQDLLSFAFAARLLGREAESVSLLARAHRAFQDQGEVRSAVRCAFWLGFSAMLNGDMAQASGWLARARRLLDDCQEQMPNGCVEEGYLLLPVGYQSVHAGEADLAYSAFAEAASIGERFGDKDLIALGRQGQGRSLIRKGDIARGIALLDEVMVGVTGDELSLNVAGGVYCSVIEACGEVFDIRRAQEWTAALDGWCSSHPDVVPYRGHCQIRRAEILQLRGRWAEALEAAQQACEQMSKSRVSGAARSAFYCLAEVHRLRGDFDEAEGAYRRASQLGKTQQPGLALLLVAKGQVENAAAIIRNLSLTVQDPSGARAIVLGIGVGVYLALDEVADARKSAQELADLARLIDAPLLHAISTRATGAVLNSEDQPAAAQEMLRRSLKFWREIDAPYEAACVRLLLSNACQKQGDCTTAELEFDAARTTFQQLGAKADLARLDGMRQQLHTQKIPLTAREIEVLVLVATGKTNRAIAEKLFISEKTVARHVSNIFVKLDLSSRAAATAYAYEHKLAQASSI